MTSISKNVDIDKLDCIVNGYINTYHRTIKMKTIDVKNSTYISFVNEIIDEEPKFKFGDHVRISKYKNVFPLCKKCPNTEFFLVRIFPYSG